MPGSAAWMVPVLFGGEEYYQKIKALFGTSLIGYWPMFEPSGIVIYDKSGNSRNGTVTNATLAGGTSPTRKQCPSFDGVGDRINVMGASLAGAFSGAEGTLSIWAKVSAAGIWTDGAEHGIFRVLTDGSNFLEVQKATINYDIVMRYRAGGNLKNHQFICAGPTVWMNLTITWSKSNDRFITYFNGQKVSYTYTSLGTWAGAIVTAAIGAIDSSGSSSFSGNISDAFLLNREATAAEIWKVFSYAKLTTKTMSILGDSISVSGAWAWNDQVVSLYGNNYVQQKNHAVASQSIVSHMAAQVLAAANDSADYIIIALGTNDDNAGNMTTLQATYEAGIVALKASNPNATIYAMNVLPEWTDSGGGTEIDKSNIRTAIAAACTAQSIACWDTYSTPWIAAANTSDGTHPNAAGHILIKDAVLALLP